MSASTQALLETIGGCVMVPREEVLIKVGQDRGSYHIYCLNCKRIVGKRDATNLLTGEGLPFPALSEQG